MNNANDTYSHKEMEELLPDYVFGRISENEKIKFEFSLKQFPDLIDEISEVRRVFKRIEATDFDRLAARQTKNLSVKVLNRMQQNRIASKNSFILRFLVPAFGLIIIIFYLINTDFNKLPEKSKIAENSVQKNDIQTTPLDLNLLNHNDLADIYDNLTSPKDLKHIFGGEEGMLEVSNQKELGQIMDSMIDYNTMKDISSLDTKTLSESPDIDNVVMDNLNSIDDNEFQNILKELSDEKIGI